MSEAKYRIPKMAMAVMVLGANGCGDDGGDKGRSNDERYAGLATSLCRLVFSCTDGPFAPEAGDAVSFTSEQECVTQFQREVKAEFASVSSDCRKAFLDYYECYVGSGCAGDVSGKCATLLLKYNEACKDE